MSIFLILAGVLLCAVFFTSAYFAAEQPKNGTLEWISMYPSPEASRQLHKLSWWDLPRCIGCVVMTLGIFLALGACIDGSMLRASLQSGLYLFLTLLPAFLATVLTFLTVRLFSGKCLPAFLATLFMACNISFQEQVFVVLRFSLLFLLLFVWLTKDGAVSWICLVLSAVTVALGAVWSIGFLPLLPLWLVSLVYGEIFRIKKENFGFGHLFLSLGVGLLALAGSFLAFSWLVLRPDNMVQFSVTLLRWIRQILPVLFSGGSLDVMDLSALSLILAGTVCLFHSGLRRKDVTAVLLWIWVFFALILTPFIPTGLLLPLASLVLGYLISRLLDRGYPGGAWVVSLTPVFLSAVAFLLLINY